MKYHDFPFVSGLWSHPLRMNMSSFGLNTWYKSLVAFCDTNTNPILPFKIRVLPKRVSPYRSSHCLNQDIFLEQGFLCQAHSLLFHLRRQLCISAFVWHTCTTFVIIPSIFLEVFLCQPLISYHFSCFFFASFFAFIFLPASILHLTVEVFLLASTSMWSKAYS